MYLRRIFLSLFLIAGGKSEPQCAFSIPGLLKSGEPVRGCLEVKRHTEPVDVEIILEINGIKHTIINEKIPAVYTFKCPDFQVPVVLAAVQVFLTFNAISQDFNYTTRRTVVVAPSGNVTLIQLDKYLYKAGQTVHCNVISLDNNLHPVDETYPTIFVTNPAGDRLFQWINQKTENGFLTIAFDIPEDPDLGQYQITVVRQHLNSVTKPLKVGEYVLPKINMAIFAPKSVTILDKNVSFKAVVTYTYGQGVQGNITGRVCRAPINYYVGNACNRHPEGLCLPITGEIDSNGTFSGNLELAPFQLDRSGYQMALTMQLTVTEEGTGIQVTELKTIPITNQFGRVYFNNQFMEPHYKKGINYFMELIAEDGLGQPLINQVVELRVNGEIVQNLTTNADGKAQYDIDTSHFAQSVIDIQVIYKNHEQCHDSTWIVPSYSNDYRSIPRFYSRTESYVQIQEPREELHCGRKYDVKIQYLFSKAGLKEGENSANFIYIMMSRTKIVEFGEHSVDLTKSLRGEFTIPFKASPDHVPIVDLIVYYMLEKEVMADIIHLNIEKCFKNKVSLSFSEKMGVPGSSVNVDLKAASESICAMRIIDSSILLLNQDQPLTAEMVYSSLQYNSLSGYNIAGYNIDPPRPPCINVNKQVLIDGVYYAPVNYPNEGDTYQEFSSVGMHLISNITLRKPEVCEQPVSFIRHDFDIPSRTGFAHTFSVSQAVTGHPIIPVTMLEINTMRIYFPEIWHFNYIHVGKNGSASVPLQVPGTITGWRGDMICLSNQSGLGMTKYPANFTSFQLFFVEISLPYSFVREEVLVLRVFLSNYLDKCAKVRATLQPSDNYIAEPVDKESVKCVCSGKRASYSWKLNATSLGVLNVSVTGETIHIGDSCEGPPDPNQPSRKDTVVQTVIVEPEGIRKEVTKSNFVCVEGTNSVIPISISPPGNAVKDSVKVKVIAIGDILGRALINPESLITEPTGCGEQTMSALKPIPLVVQYLNLTGRLTEETKDRAVQNMAIGYRKLLYFRNDDGSFGAFGRGKSKASAWLTLLVLETLQNIKPYTFVEDKIFNQALVYLEQLQDLATGCFKPRGMLFNNALKGGAEDSVSFTAAVVATLLMSSYTASPTLLRPALNCLEAASRTEQCVYNLAMLCYAFQVAGNEERRNAMFQMLKDMAIVEEGTVHWERPVKPEKQKSYMFSPPAASADIEITAHVLLAMTKGPAPSPQELTYMSEIALWLSQQQNLHGSYSSTSDTVVVLQALCGYGSLVYQKDATNSVQVKYGEEVIREFNLDTANRLLFQTQSLSHLPGEYSMTVNGNGCVLLQTSVEFNVPVSQEDAAFSLSVNTSSENCVNGVAYTFPVGINVSYHGIQNQSNMALIDLHLPSGYSADYQSLVQLRYQVPKVEQKNNHIIIYLNNVSNETLSFYLTLEMNARVYNFQPKTIKIWDYYEKDEYGVAVLYHPCSLK